MRKFQVVSPYQPSGDQGQAIEKLSAGFLKGDRFQTLKGVTGSGKTFTMAKIIECEEVLKKEGLFVQDEKTGLSKPHPLAKWQDALRYTLKGYLTELGFTPASRSKVNIQPKESDTNEFLKL